MQGVQGGCSGLRYATRFGPARILESGKERPPARVAVGVAQIRQDESRISLLPQISLPPPHPCSTSFFPIQLRIREWSHPDPRLCISRGFRAIFPKIAPSFRKLSDISPSTHPLFIPNTVMPLENEKREEIDNFCSFSSQIFFIHLLNVIMIFLFFDSDSSS